MEKVIEVRGLVKDYKKLRAVDNLDLDLYKGEILGLLGPNGSGKTTTINCILSLLKKSGGEVRIFGKEMTPTSYDLKKRIGVVFQEVGVFEELTVYENIDYFCGLYIKDKEERGRCVSDALDLVGLKKYEKFKPKELSGGLLRRLNIACGISHKPEIIFFDEPTVAVDPQSRENILDGIRKLNEEGSSIIYTSHYMEEVEELCDEIVILDGGKILAQGSLSDLKDLIEVDQKVSFEGEAIPEETLDKIRGMENLLDFSYKDPVAKLSFKKGEENLVALLKILEEGGVSYNHLSSELPSLNDVFLSLTGRQLRD